MAKTYVERTCRCVGECVEIDDVDVSLMQVLRTDAARNAERWVRIDNLDHRSVIHRTDVDLRQRVAHLVRIGLLVRTTRLIDGEQVRGVIVAARPEKEAFPACAGGRGWTNDDKNWLKAMGVGF